MEFNNDMQKAIWKSINPNERTSLSSGSEFYRQIYEFRKGIQTLRTDSLASFRCVFFCPKTNKKAYLPRTKNLPLGYYKPHIFKNPSEAYNEGLSATVPVDI